MSLGCSLTYYVDAEHISPGHDKLTNGRRFTHHSVVDGRFLWQGHVAVFFCLWPMANG